MTEPRSDLQRCIICMRLFIKRPEAVCSVDCKRKAEQSAATAPSSIANDY